MKLIAFDNSKDVFFFGGTFLFSFFSCFAFFLTKIYSNKSLNVRLQIIMSFFITRKKACEWMIIIIIVFFIFPSMYFFFVRDRGRFCYRARTSVCCVGKCYVHKRVNVNLFLCFEGEKMMIIIHDHLIFSFRIFPLLRPLKTLKFLSRKQKTVQ